MRQLYNSFSFLKVLEELYNKSIYEGVFPDCLKVARVEPIFKGGTASNVSNYRPISVLPVFSQIFEKAAHLRIYRYLSSKSILSDYQFGFRKGRVL